MTRSPRRRSSSPPARAISPRKGLDAGLVSRPGMMKPGIKAEQLVGKRYAITAP